MPTIADGHIRSIWRNGQNVIRVYHGEHLVWPRFPNSIRPLINVTLHNTVRELTARIDVVNRRDNSLTIDWGDGTPAQGVTTDGHGHLDAKHTYGSAGVYSVSVVATGGGRWRGMFDLKTPHALVLHPHPTGLQVALDVSLRTQAPVQIDWGDGSPQEPVVWPDAKATHTTVTHTYAAGGQYTITGHDAGGQTEVTATTVAPPTATIHMDSPMLDQVRVSWTSSVPDPIMRVGSQVIQLHGTSGTERHVHIPEGPQVSILVEATDQGAVGVSSEIIAQRGTAAGGQVKAMLIGEVSGSEFTGYIVAEGAGSWRPSFPWPAVNVADGRHPVHVAFPHAGPQTITVTWDKPGGLSGSTPTTLASVALTSTPSIPPPATALTAAVDTAASSWPDVVLTGTASSPSIRIDWTWGDPTDPYIGPPVQTILVGGSGQWQIERDFRGSGLAARPTFTVTEVGGQGRSITV